jgi:hypothetical protein
MPRLQEAEDSHLPVLFPLPLRRAVLPLAVQARPCPCSASCLATL